VIDDEFCFWLLLFGRCLVDDPTPSLPSQKQREEEEEEEEEL
jgi:hypothetical protein